MTSKERLLKTLRGEIPDRVPISTYEIVGFNSKSFENNQASYDGLTDFIREYSDCVCMWHPQRNGWLAESAYQVEVDEEKSQPEPGVTDTHLTLHTPRGDLTHMTKVMENVNTTWETEHWCKSTADVDKFMSIPYEPLEYDFSDYSRIIAEVGDNGIIMQSLSDPMYMAAGLMEFGEYTIWAMTETDHFRKTVEEMAERCMENLRRMLAVQVVDLYRICGPEYMTLPYLPPQYFAEFVTPYLIKMTEMIHGAGGMVRIHCHGKIRDILDEMIKVEAVAWDPCEAPPDGDIELDEIKARAPEVCLFGNIQLKLLEHGSTEEVKAYVKKIMDQAKAGGRFVIMPTAGPINIPLSPKTEENYKTFIQTALELGEY